MFTNAIGAVTFFAANLNNANTIAIGIESCYNTNGTSWTTNTIVTNTSKNTFTQHVVTNLLNPSSNQFIRLRKYSAGSSGYGLTIDDIVISYPPANVAISNVFIDPGYPSATETVRVSCDITSSNPQFPAYAITPAVYLRRADDPSTNFDVRPMARTTGNHFERWLPCRSKPATSRSNITSSATLRVITGPHPKTEAPSITPPAATPVRPTMSSAHSLRTTEPSALS